MIHNKTLVALLCSLQVVGMANAAYDQNQNYYTPPSSASREVILSDQELMKKVNSKIGPGVFSKGYEQVQAQVNSGVVILQGAVNSLEDKDKVEKLVSNINGVRGVNNLLAVRDNQSANRREDFPQDRAVTANDAQLNKRIRDTISKGWFTTSYKSIGLNTNDGFVVIEGVVDTPRDQQKIIDQIQAIEGVRNIRSNLRINNP